MKKVIIIVGILLLIGFLSQVVFWFGPMFIFNPSITDKMDKVADKAVTDYNNSVPTAKYTFYSITDDMLNLQLDCNNLTFVPAEFRNAKYYCQNIYKTDENKIAQEVANSGAARLVLYGKYSSYNCPTIVNSDKYIIAECYRHAKFLDNYQIQKTTEIFGMKTLKDKVNFYITYSDDQTKEICNRERNDNNGLICLWNNTVYIPVEMLKDRAEGVLTAYQFERKGDLKITYTLKVVFPKNCPVSNLHEMQHYFDFQDYGSNAPSWFEETMVVLLQDMVSNQLCSPGSTISQIYREEANGTKTKLENYDMFSLNNEEPLDSRVEDYAQNNQCRRGIAMVISRYVDKYKAQYLPVLFAYLKRQGDLTTETNIAKAVLATANNDSRIKNFLVQNSCSL